jgi:hypothetical protein
MTENRRSEEFDKDIELAAAQAKIAEAQGAFFTKISLVITTYVSLLTLLNGSLIQLHFDWYLWFLPTVAITVIILLIIRWASRDYKQSMNNAMKDFRLIYERKLIDWPMYKDVN